jgi:cell division protein FtsB
MMTKVLASVTAALLLALGFTGYLLKTSYERNAALTQANAQLTTALEAKTNATKQRATTDGAVRRMAPADKRERLR